VVPLHTRVPRRGVRGAAKFGITVFLLIFFLQKVPICHFFKDLKGAANQKRLKNTGISVSNFFIFYNFGTFLVDSFLNASQKKHTLKYN
jgi:hypothetical protein